MPLYIRLAIAGLAVIHSTQVQAHGGDHYCPDWVSTIVGSWMLANPNAPGVQLHLSSPRCGLSCLTSFRSSASNYSSEPALLTESPWRVASITKPFTAVAALKLAEQDHLAVHTPIINYLPSWATTLLEEQQGATNASLITSWMLLHHTSGLDDYTGATFIQEELANTSYRWTPQTILEFAATHGKPVGAPGETFFYSSTGYTYLGLVIENVTGLGLAESIRKLDKLDDLNMPSTWWEILEPTPKDVLPLAGQYYDTIDVTKLDASYDLYGGGGLDSNSHDLSQFAAAVHTGKVLEPDTLRLMYSAVPIPDGPEGETYGCGWFNRTIAGQQAWWHGGFLGGWMYHIRSLDLTFSGTINQQKESPSSLIDLLVEAIIQQQPCRPQGLGTAG